MKNKLIRFAALIIIVILTGCAAPQKKEGIAFFPPPPELPRIQYLTFLTSEKDLGESQSAFDRFVVGQKKDHRLDKPYGVAFYKDKIYVCDSNSTVFVFDLVKKTLSQLSGAQGPGKLLQPLNISIDKDGNKYVTDPIRGQVVVFDKTDAYVNVFGLPGNWKPVDAVVYGDRLYVVDEKNALIKVFDKKTGAQIKEFGRQGEPTEMLAMPTNLAFDSDGYLYVSDAGRFQVVKFDRDGHFISAIGKIGANPAHFARPRGVAFDRDNRMYVVDAAFNNVQMFNNDAQLLLFFGGPGTKPGDLYLPAKVAVDYDNINYFQKYADPDFELEGLIAVTSQFEKRLVSIYGVGKQKGKTYPSDEVLKKDLREKLEKQMKEQTPQQMEDVQKSN
ncbi:MAG: 6-bladed beta-propeller [Thermodesulfovibrionales bacterium]